MATFASLSGLKLSAVSGSGAMTAATVLQATTSCTKDAKRSGFGKPNTRP